MHVCVVCSRFPSISQTFIDAQITGLLSRGARVDVVAFECPVSDTEHGHVPDLLRSVTLRYRDKVNPGALARRLDALRLALSPKWPSLSSRWRAWNETELTLRSQETVFTAMPFLDAPRYDAIVCHFGYTALRLVPLRRMGLLPGKLAVAFHGADLSRFIQSHGAEPYRSLFETADLFLPVSDRWRKTLVSLGCPAERIQVHRMGIDTSQFSYFERSAPVDRPFRLMSVARLVDKKGIEYAIRAIAALPRTLASSIEYTIVGDGPLRGQLEALSKQLELEGVVRFAGWQAQDEVATMIRSADAMLVPSVTAADGDQEGLPVVLMEAMATGLPVIATRHSGIPELVHHGQTGLLVEERDVEPLAHAIERLVTDGRLRKQLASNGRRLVERQHDNERLNDDLIDTLQRLVSPQRRPTDSGTEHWLGATGDGTF